MRQGRFLVAPGLAVVLCCAAEDDLPNGAVAKEPADWTRSSASWTAPAATVMPSRGPRRLDLDQLDAALREATGGDGWVVTVAGQPARPFDDLSSTLGKPDFLQRTDEDLSPSTVFHKFLADAANSTCLKAVERDLAGDATPVVFLPGASISEAGRRAQMARLLLRFHGRRVPGDGPDVDRWLGLYHAIAAASEDASAWAAVCVALVIHPDFYTL